MGMRLTYDGPGGWAEWTGEAAERLWQDALDGAALRRLREALPREWKWSLSPSGADAGFSVMAFSPGWWSCGCPEDEQRIGFGATIAEAADKCREALG